MTRALAARVADVGRYCAVTLNQTLELWAQAASESELRSYKEAVANCAGILWTNLFFPVMKAHPDLLPPELRQPLPQADDEQS